MYRPLCGSGWILRIPRTSTGRPYPPSGSSVFGGTRVYPPLCGKGWILCIPWSPMGRPYPTGGPGRVGGIWVYGPLCGRGRIPCIPSSPTRHPYLPCSQGGIGGTREYPPLCGRALTLCIRRYERILLLLGYRWAIFVQNWGGWVNALEGSFFCRFLWVFLKNCDFFLFLKIMKTSSPVHNSVHNSEFSL